MRKLKFKLIPFIIAVLIVTVATTLIPLYAYEKYDTNKIKFINNYFHYEDYSSVETSELIDNFVKFESNHYSVAGDQFSFYDVQSKKPINSTPFKDSSSFELDGSTYSDGVLHLNGYFDLKIYAETNYNIDQEVWVYTYYLYVFNVNYNKIQDISHLYLCFVDGITTEENSSEFVGTVKLDQVINEITNGDSASASSVNLPSYKFEGKSIASYEMNIRDNKATGDSINDDNIPYVYRLLTMSESLSYNAEEAGYEETVTESRWLSELDSSTISIFYSGSSDLSNTGKKDDLKELVRATYTKKYENAEAFNAAEPAGANKDLKTAGYGKFIFPHILIVAGVTLLISGILAFLFYNIWQDDPNEPKEKTKVVKIPRKE